MSGIKGRKTYSDALKKQIADEYMRGESNMSALQKKYKIASFASIHTWVHKYGSGDVNSVRGFTKLTRPKSLSCQREMRIVKNYTRSLCKALNEKLCLSLITSKNERHTFCLRTCILKKNCWIWANRRTSLQIYGHQRI